MKPKPGRFVLQKHIYVWSLSVAGLLLVLVLMGVILRGTTAPALKTGAVPAAQFNGERALKMLRALNGQDTPHPNGSEAQQLIRQKLVAEFERLGYQPEVQQALIAGRDRAPVEVNNIIALLAGARTGKAVLLAAHYDSVPNGPGAADDGAGTVASLEIARILASEPRPQNTVIFLLTDGEEAGLLGAQAFVLKHPLAQQVGAVVNLEARGSSGPSLMFETSDHNAWLVRHLAASVPRPVMSSAFSSVYQWLPNRTDLSVFKSNGMAGVNFAFMGSPLHYHTALDNIANLEPGALQHEGDNGLSMVRTLAAADLESSTPSGNAVFFDVLGLGVIWWTEKWSLVLAVVAASGVALSLISLLRQRVINVYSIAWGIFGFILSPFIAAALATSFSLAMWKAETWSRAWGTSSMPAVFTFWTCGLAASSLLATWLGGRASLVGLWTGNWVAWAVLSVFTAAKVIGLSYLFIVPTLAAGLSALPWTLRGAGVEVGLLVSVMVSCVVTSLLWFPLAWFFYDGVGLLGMPLVSVQLALVASTVGPLIGSLKSRRRWAIPATLMTLACLGAAATFMTPDRVR